MMDLEALFQFDEAVIDKTAVLKQIEQNMKEHQLDTAVQFPQFAVATLAYTDDSRFSRSLYHYLADLNDKYDQVWLDAPPPPSGSLVAQVVAQLKRPLQQLAIYTSNQSAQKQMAVNDDLRRILVALVQQLEQPHPQIEALQAEVERLKKRVAELEAKQNE